MIYGLVIYTNSCLSLWAHGFSPPVFPQMLMSVQHSPYQSVPLMPPVPTLWEAIIVPASKVLLVMAGIVQVWPLSSCAIQGAVSKPCTFLVPYGCCEMTNLFQILMSVIQPSLVTTGQVALTPLALLCAHAKLATEEMEDQAAVSV